MTLLHSHNRGTHMRKKSPTYEATYIVTRTRNTSVVPPIPAASVTFQMERPNVNSITNLCRMVIMTGLAYYDHAAEYVITEVVPVTNDVAHTQTWYFAGDRFFSQS